MNLRKFLAPNIAILLVLSAFWLMGVDSVVRTQNDREENVQKYIQAQRQILDNYVEKINIADLYKSSLKGFISNLEDSSANLKNTPLDTTLKNLEIDDLRKSVEKFDQAYRYISEHYPNENMDKRTEDAIRGMFNMLDPHSIYIEAKASEAIEENFKGKFQGIGIQFNVINDTIMVVSPISGGPSDKLGIQSGDRIISIEDSSAIGFSNKDVMNALRGPKGTEVDVIIKRLNRKDPLNFTIVRDDIPLYTVDTSYMLDDETGYVKINRFAATTHQEFMKAIRDLQDNGMDRLMLDLRGNPGGYLGQAIAIAEEFFPRDTKIVSTKSRHARFTETYDSRRDGEFKDTPLIILVDEGSASASEIVSGAVQDHDRGLIVGQRTYGKGLVQQQYGLIDSSNIRVTISRYYTPSGRLIQKPYSKGSENYAYEIYKREEDAVTDVKEYISHVPDSLIYNTDAGRTVYGGGGIVPDHLIQKDTSRTFAVTNFMLQKRLDIKFVRSYLDKHNGEVQDKWENNFDKFVEQFEWNESDYADMLDLFQKENLTVSDTFSEPEIKSDTLIISQDHFDEIKWMVGGYMKAEMATQIWNQKKSYPVINDVFDKAIDKAMNLWPEASAYAANNVKVSNQRRFK